MKALSGEACYRLVGHWFKSPRSVGVGRSKWFQRFVTHYGESSTIVAGVDRKEVKKKAMKLHLFEISRHLVYGRKFRIRHAFGEVFCIGGFFDKYKRLPTKKDKAIIIFRDDEKYLISKTNEYDDYAYRVVSVLDVRFLGSVP